VRCRRASLSPTHVQVSGVEINLIPAEINQFAGPLSGYILL
jgi:hypothetical protein